MLAKDILKLLRDNPNAEICVDAGAYAQPINKVSVMDVNSVKVGGDYSYSLPLSGPTKQIIVIS